MAELSVPRSSATSPTASQSRAPLIGVMIVSRSYRLYRSSRSGWGTTTGSGCCSGWAVGGAPGGTVTAAGGATGGVGATPVGFGEATEGLEVRVEGTEGG